MAGASSRRHLSKEDVTHIKELGKLGFPIEAIVAVVGKISYRQVDVYIKDKRPPKSRLKPRKRGRHYRSWVEAYEEFKQLKGELIGSEEQAKIVDLVPAGFQEMVDWLKPHRPKVDLENFIITCKGLIIRYISLYYHSTANKDVVPELKPWCAENWDKNYIFIYEDEWRDKNRLVRSILSYRMKIDKNIKYLHARKLRGAILNAVKFRDFFNENHLEGFTAPMNTKRSPFYVEKMQREWGVGLYDGEELVAAGKINRKNVLIRFCTKQGYCVRGAFTKIVALLEKALGSITVKISVRLGPAHTLRRYGMASLSSYKVKLSDNGSLIATDLEKRYSSSDMFVNSLDKRATEIFQYVPKKMYYLGRAGVYSWFLWGTRKPIYFIQRVGNWYFQTHKPDALPDGATSPSATSSKTPPSE